MSFRKLEAIKDAVLSSALTSPMAWVLAAFMAAHIAFVYNVLHVRKGIYVAHDIQKECPESGMIMERDTTRYQLYRLFKELDVKKPRHEAFLAFWIIAVIAIVGTLGYVVWKSKDPFNAFPKSFAVLCITLLILLIITKRVMSTVVGMGDGKRTSLAHMTDQIKNEYETNILAHMPMTDVKGNNALLEAMPADFEKAIMHRWLLVHPSSRDTKPIEWSKLPNDEKMGYFVPKDDNKFVLNATFADNIVEKGATAESVNAKASSDPEVNKTKKLFENLNAIRNPDLYNEINRLKNVFRGLEFLTAFPVIVATIGWRLHASGWMVV
jgi:hypothetical protein